MLCHAVGLIRLFVTGYWRRLLTLYGCCQAHVMPGSKARKLYVHYRGGPESHTQVLHIADAVVTVDDLCKQLASTLNAAQGLTLDSRKLQVASAKGRAFGRSHLVHKAFDCDADVYVSLTAEERGSTKSVNQVAPDLPGLPRVAQPYSSGRSGDGPEKAAQDSNLLNAQDAKSQQQHKASPLIAPLLSQASQKEAAQHLRAAAFIYQQVHSFRTCPLIHHWL